MFVLINLTLIPASQREKKLLLLPYFQRTSGVTAAPFFQRGCKGKCLYLFDQLFLRIRPRIFDVRMFLRTVCFYWDGKCTTLKLPVKTFRLIIYSHPHSVQLSNIVSKSGREDIH